MMKVWKLGMLGGALYAVAGAVMADCRPEAGGTPFIGTTPLQGANLTVGREVALGSIVYRQRLNPVQFTSEVVCDPSPRPRTFTTEMETTPLALTSWSTGRYAGKVYETGVPGIGVAVANVFYNAVIPFRNGIEFQCQNGCTIERAVSSTPYEMVLIKIGDTTSGTISGADLPTFKSGLAPRGSTVGPLPITQAGFSGSINVVSRTCTTPDVQVDMGARKVSEFAGVNTGTPWKDFNIALNDCPAFFGRFPTSGPVLSSDGSIVSAGTRVANAIGYRVDPNQTPIDASQGVLTLDDSAAGSPAAASGVGLQIADATEAPISLATLLSSGITPSTMDGASYTIPLKARYLQTEATIVAGPANATAVFTINYE